MSVLFMSDSELEELTGFKAPKYQTQWLDKNRWRYATDRHNKPKVSRDYFGERVGARALAHAGQASQAPNLAQPDFAALDRR